jgi:hypothetical protein
MPGVATNAHRETSYPPINRLINQSNQTGPNLIHHLPRLRRSRPRSRTLTLPSTPAATTAISELHFRPLQTLPLPVARAHIATNPRRPRVVPSRTTLAFGREAAFAVLAAVDDILQALALAWLGDLGPVQILAGLGVVCDVGHGGGGDLALATGACTCIEVRGGVDFLLARGLELMLRLVVLLLVVLLLLVHGLRRGLMVLLGSSGGRKGGDVGLEVGELSRLGWRRLVDEVCFAEWWVRTRVL